MVTAVAAGYLWAAVAGDGIHALKGTAALDKADSFPDANVVFIVALARAGGVGMRGVSGGSRRERRRLAVLQRLQTAEAHFDPDPVSWAAPELVRQLRRLSAAERDTLLLVVWGELSYAEAASALSVPVGTIRSRIARARQRLAAAIAVDRGDSVALHPHAADPGDVNA